jgi:hypothetical protein
MDYGLEEEIALQKMKEAQALRKTPIANIGDTFGHIYVPNYGAMSNSVIDRISGNKMEDDAIARRRELSDQQDVEVNALQKQLMTPEKVLRQGEGPLLDPTRDMTAAEENQRQMGIGMKMMNLPKARAIGTQFVNSGVGFPEKQALAEAQQAATREATAQRLAQTAEQNRLYKLTVEQQVEAARARAEAPLIAAREKAEAKAEAKQTDLNEARGRSAAILNDMEKIVNKLEAGGGITVEGEGISNTGPALANTALGKTMGRMFGTENQTQRDLWQSQRQNLLAELKQAKNLPASMMNSNIELQNFLQSIGDTSMNSTTLREIIARARPILAAQGSGDEGSAAPSQSKTVGGKTYQKINGQWYDTSN